MPHIGWVFVERAAGAGADQPQVAVAEARGGGAASASASRRAAGRSSKAASQPMPVPTAPPPGATVARDGGDRPRTPDGSRRRRARRPRRPRGAAPVNDLLPFLAFVEHHPVGTSVNGVVESYSSHGAYVSIGDVRGLRAAAADGRPAAAQRPRGDARSATSVTLVVESFAPARRSIDLAVPAMATAGPQVVRDAVSCEELAEAVERPGEAGQGGQEATAREASGQGVGRRAVEEAAAEVVSAAERAAARSGPPTKAASTKTQAAATKAAAHEGDQAARRHARPRRAPAKQAAPRKRAAKQVAPDAAQAGGDGRRRIGGDRRRAAQAGAAQAVLELVGIRRRRGGLRGAA